MGAPKAHLTLQGRPILEYLIDRWRWPGPTLLVTAPGRERPPGWGGFTREVSDPVAGAGPMRGVLTALEAVSTDLLVVTTCDMPGVGTEQFAWLIDLLSERDELLGLMARRGETVEPFPLALRAAAIEVVRERFDAGQRSTYRHGELPRFAVEPAPAQWGERVWVNLNTPDDLARFDV